MDDKNLINNFQRIENAKQFFEQIDPFMKLMTQYQCAMLEVKTKLEVLDMDLSMKS